MLSFIGTMMEVCNISIRIHGITSQKMCNLNVHCHENIKSQNIVYYFLNL
jgi:hypothetical protein